MMRVLRTLRIMLPWKPSEAGGYFAKIEAGQHASSPLLELEHTVVRPLYGTIMLANGRSTIWLGAPKYLRE
jgi:hypothetical protein